MAVSLIAEATTPGTHRVRIPAYVSSVLAQLAIPTDARALIVFAEVGGRSAVAASDRCEATALGEAGFATLTFDLLTPDEAAAEGTTQLLAFDIRFLMRRLSHIMAWLADHPPTRHLPVAIFGVGAGAAAAIAEAAVSTNVRALVLRDARTDLVPIAVSHLRVPTLLLADSTDADTIQRNQAALEQIDAPSELAILENHSCAFGQSGSHDEAALLAVEWLDRHTPGRADPTPPLTRSSIRPLIGHPGDIGSLMSQRRDGEWHSRSGQR
jgi:putative phosphoribosyl transferase